MRDTRPDDYTFEIVAYSVILLALIGLGAIGYLIFNWVF
jgi:hypothetical protein